VILGAVSIIGLIVISLMLSLIPNLLGDNIMLGASFLWLVILVPAFRNAVELHTEILYGHAYQTSRILLLGYLSTLKAFLLILVLGHFTEFEDTALALNGVFGVLYLASALATYGRILKLDPHKN